MNRLAIFVEGQTEQVFAEKLLLEIAGAKDIRIEKRKASGGRRGKRSIRRVEASAVDSDQHYYALIVDCGQDERVASDIREQYDQLTKKGYQAIVGIRDVYPFAREDTPRLRRGLRYQVRTKPVEVLFVLAVMEIEAWFIAEHTHFGRVDPELTMDRIRREIRFDPTVDDVESRDRPAEDLNLIYQLVGKAYNKGKTNVERTVDALDFTTVYLELGQRIDDLQKLVDQIDAFLAAPSDG